MTLDSLVYLIGVYWPFLAGAGLVGMVTGWWSVPARRG
jgi:hypothetical protein